ncbi:MAG: dCTP deaminase [Chloroflexaceae bacterium]|nr:dCTP deaminase [Chloroflexaceae bacterium]
MSIKSDRWIRRMALEQGMIEPFVDGQVREGVVSYGLSSYGYDMRVADEFRVFTNVYNTMIDPKNFDQRLLVEVQGDYCDIPPNSFALARSVEYFRIPRQVLCVVLGKSTYARCFRGDTRVALVDGTSLSLEAMALRAEQGEHFWGYSVSEYGRIIVTLLDNPRYIGRDPLMGIVLDNGETIYCTPDHKFMLRDGQMSQADTLRPGTSLFPLYRDIFRGYEGVYQPLTGHFTPTHRLADEWNTRNGIYDDVEHTHRHHCDHNRRNNMPWNIIRMNASDHVRHHNVENFGEEFDPIEHGLAIRNAFQRLQLDPDWHRQYRESQQIKAYQFWNEEAYADARQRCRAAHRRYWANPEHRERQRQRQENYWNDPGHRAERSRMSKQAWDNDDGTRRQKQQEIARSIRLREDITEAVVLHALNEAGSIRGAARILECDRAVFRRFPEAIARFRGQNRENHKVVDILSLPGEHDVYCLTVPEAGNFALESGVFVSNCSIIVNVTPLEPGWQGHITIEISNTAPLPARIYAHEGIGQVLFFESDEACELSYADRKGKYQQQRGIVLPHIEVRRSGEGEET